MDGPAPTCAETVGTVPPKKPKTKQERIEAGLGHDILGLWNHATELARRIHPEAESDLLADGTRCAAEFSKLDGGGDESRYPETLDGGPSLAHIHQINLRNLREQMERASRALGYVDGIVEYEDELRRLDSE